MSKIMEQASLTSGSQAGHVGQVMSGSNDGQRKTEKFRFKEIGMLLAVAAIVVGIAGYGVYSQRSRSESRTSPIIEPVTVSPVDSPAPPSGAIAQTVQLSQPLPAPAVSPVTGPEPSPAETQTESKHADIYFDFGKSRLRADATAILQQHAAVLKQDSRWAVLIQGYADQHGPTEYNRTLALRRADSVKQFLAELGVPESSMKVVSLGKDSAICDDQSRTCRRLNRRVHLEMVKLDAPPAVSSIATTVEEQTEETDSMDGEIPVTSASADQPNQDAVAPTVDQP